MADTELNLEAERAAFEAAVRELDVPADALDRWDHGDYVNEQIAANWSGWKMARRSTSSVSEGEMPELPKVPRTYQQTDAERASIEAYGRACVAADRRARQGEPAKCSGCDPAEGFCRDCREAERATKAAAPADAPWHDAVLAECMRIETGYQPADPVATVKAVIDWHVHEARGVVEGVKIMADNYVRLTCGRAPAEDAREEVPRAEQVLRRLLAYRVSGALLYTDGGELQDASTHPWIDFKRDSVDSIEANLIERARRASSVPAIQGTGREKEGLPLDVSRITGVVYQERRQHEVVVKFGRSKTAADRFLNQFGSIVLAEHSAAPAHPGEEGEVK